MVPTPTLGSRKREPQLDTLRALAVFGVYCSHFYSAESRLGVWGVRLFFILSGYLITNILADFPRASTADNLKRFYGRRIVRIWPAYYLMLFACLLLDGHLGIEGVKASFLWHAAFLSNYWYSFGNSQPWIFQHLWTLAAEEQFYLVWPLLFVSCTARVLRDMCIVFVTAVLIYRLGAMTVTGYDTKTSIPLETFDAIAAGCLLSLVCRQSAFLAEWHWALAGICSLVAVTFAEIYRDATFLWWACMQTALLLPMAIIVLAAAQGKLPPFFNNRLLSGLGRISYGAYLYHLPVWGALLFLSPRFGLPFTERGAPLFLVAGSISIVVALISWRLIERPLLRRNEKAIAV